MSRPTNGDPPLPAVAEEYPVPCPKCGTDATLRGVSIIVGNANLLHLTIVCGGCPHSWIVEKPTFPVGARDRGEP
jgi:hypothetical protein